MDQLQIPEGLRKGSQRQREELTDWEAGSARH